MKRGGDVTVPDLLQRVRSSCRKVAEEGSLVRIDHDALPRYAETLPRAELALPQMDPAIHYLDQGADTVAFFLILDAVNFGSGSFAEIFGDPRRSGFRAIASALKARFEVDGPLSSGALRRITPGECAAIFQLPPANPAASRLMAEFARALNDLGHFVETRFNGQFPNLVSAAGNSAEKLVELLVTMPLFNDQATWRGEEVCFFKRAQLAAADLFIAFGGKGPGRFHDIDRLTICADNLVPHVLRLDGLLVYRDDLLSRIEKGEPIPAGSEEEVAIRAAAVHAGELIVDELRKRGEQVNAMMLDNFLWHRGQQPRYRAYPRHKSLTVFY